MLLTFEYVIAVCQNCSGFKSSYMCGCGETYPQHRMIVETKEEREARGHPVGMDTPYKAMGGLTGFSSLAEGYMRLDPSGRGMCSQVWWILIIDHSCRMTCSAVRHTGYVVQ